jgi:hypothetical protein
MSLMDNWVGDINPATITGHGGGLADNGSGGLMTGMASSVTTRPGADAPGWSPESGLFWFGAFALLAAGAIVISTAVDVGPVRLKGKV